MINIIPSVKTRVVKATGLKSFMFCGVFRSRIMPILKRMDLVDFEHVQPVETLASRYFREISWIQVTSLGKKIFKSIGNLREHRGD